MDRNNNNIDWGGWLLTIIMLGAFWPIGLVLLFRQLTGYSKRGNARAKRHPYDLERERRGGAGSAGYQWNVVQPGQTGGTSASGTGTAQNPGAARTAQNANNSAAYNIGAYGASQPISGVRASQPGAARSTAYGQNPQSAQNAQNPGGASWETVKKTAPKKAGRPEGKALALGRTLTTIGGIVAALFGVAILATIGDYWGSWRYMFSDLFPLLGFFGAGVVCLFAGGKQRKKGKRYKKYLSYIGKNQEVSIPTLASAMGVKEKVVYEDLQDMLDDGVLPMGYIDVAEGMLVLSDAGIARHDAPQPEPEAEPVKKTVEDENAILQEIREVNDAIPDAAMSAKIDRIGEITGKILDYQRSHPSKSGQLRSFLNYYLPTTLKILRAYAQLDAQGIEGENITAAKKRIESMMDQVVDGFEKQLDKLFADDALDITADVAVLENMLRKDGLSGGMTLGGDPIAAGEGFSPQQSYLDLQKVADELEAQSKDKDDGQITLQL